ncbi:MAG: hypothetical protein RLZZ314_1829 [Bacteroidota bacterium]|jgi:hypothetical protein|nr:DUF4956 domain-containing protein [Bacteroidota bacterium]
MILLDTLSSALLYALTPSLDDGWGQLLALFGLNLASALVVVRVIYHMAAKRRDFVFTFMLVSTSVFLLCRLLAGVEIDLAFALGLFAIFGIIRYRTNAIPIREMTYLFVVIALAVVNALAPLAASWAEIVLANLLIWLMTFVLERLWFVEHLATKIVIYDRIDLLHEGRRAELIADLERRTGVSIVHLEIGKVDLLRDTANLKIHFSQDKEPGHFEESEF